MAYQILRNKNIDIQASDEVIDFFEQNKLKLYDYFEREVCFQLINSFHMGRLGGLFFRRGQLRKRDYHAANTACQTALHTCYRV